MAKKKMKVKKTDKNVDLSRVTVGMFLDNVKIGHDGITGFKVTAEMFLSDMKFNSIPLDEEQFMRALKMCCKQEVFVLPIMVFNGLMQDNAQLRQELQATRQVLEQSFAKKKKKVETNAKKKKAAGKTRKVR